MKILSMTATFGKLEGATLTPGPGLNLIHAPNEGGKSTWAAFWKAMLYGIDTRDRDKKGYLADKNRWQPWSGAPMAGEMTLEWQGRAITIRRGPRGSVPFGAFSAVYAGTAEPVPGLTADNCGLTLTGVGREVFERSAFIGGALTVSAAPELERRIAALVSSGEETVSFSQAESRLKEFLNRRRVNRSVGLIPKLEEALTRVKATQAELEELTREIVRLEGVQADLTLRQRDLTAEAEIHRRLAQKALNRRYAQAGEELNAAISQRAALESEATKYGPLPAREDLKRAQGELQYLKVLDEEIQQGNEALTQADEAYVQAQIAARDDRFDGMTGEEAVLLARQAVQTHEEGLAAAAKTRSRSLLCLFAGLLTGAAAPILFLTEVLPARSPVLFGLVGLAAVLLIAALVLHSGAKKAQLAATRPLARYSAATPAELEAMAEDYAARCAAAQAAADRAKAVRGALNNRLARREISHADLLDFVHTFAPQATGLFGCSAALSRALNLEHELELARAKESLCLRRREDLAAQGGQDFDTLEFLHTPDRTPEETNRALADVSARLEDTARRLNQALGRQNAMGDPVALAARREELEGELTRRTGEYQAITLAMDTLKEANARLQERLSPELNRLTGQYMARLTDGQYAAVTLNRELEGAALRPGDVLPRSALALSRGTADQLYLAARLALCSLCLPEKPPILLDDALAAFDDGRMEQALALLAELAGEQQVLLFSCQRRESDAAADLPGITRLTL